MSEPLISVIVPVYKAEAYLQRCVDSIRHQTYKNLEIILVDDGSPDRCGQMCDAFAQEDDRIRVFHTENRGQASARNTGLDAMTGELVGFVDSDDWILPTMYEVLYSRMISENAGASCCGIGRFKNGKCVSYFNDQLQDTFTVTGEQVQLELLRDYRITSSPCDKLYRAEVFENNRMRVGMVYEDQAAMPFWLAAANCVTYTAEPFYCYEQTNSSTTRGHFQLRQYDKVRASKIRLDYYKEMFPGCVVNGKIEYLEDCMYCIYKSTRLSEWKQLRQELIPEAKRTADELLKEGIPKKLWIKCIFLKIHPWLLALLMFVNSKVRGLEG